MSDCLGLPDRALGWGLGVQPRRCTEALLLVGDTMPGGYNPVIGMDVAQFSIKVTSAWGREGQEELSAEVVSFI